MGANHGTVTGTCISHPIDTDDQIGGVVWCSSDIRFGPCCDGDLCLGQVKCVPFTPVLENLEEGNHHNQVLQF